MPDELLTRWRCDSCHVVLEVKGNGQPEYWVRLERRMPPRHAEPITIADLCEKCWGQVQAIIRAPQHNHITTVVKSVGECPACDAQLGRSDG